MKTCPFCAVVDSRIYLENKATLAVPDAYPLAENTLSKYYGAIPARRVQIVE